MKTLQSKITLLCITVCIITGGVFSFYSFEENYKYLIESRINSSKNDMSLFSESIQAKINELKGDVLFLSSTPPIKGVMRAHFNNGIDPLDGSSLQSWKNRLEVIFEEMLYTKTRYTQLRYIGAGDSGKELVRVERIGNRIIRVPEIDLQEKGSRDYVKNGLTSPMLKVYLSPFSLNMERGKISYPLQPVIRGVVPIYQNAGKPFGVVVVNLDYTKIFKEMEEQIGKEYQFKIIDNNANILSASRQELVGKKTKDLDDSVRQSLAKLMQKSVGTNSKSIEVNDEIYIINRLKYNDLDPSSYLDLILLIDKASLKDEIQSDVNKHIFLLFIIVMVTTFIALIFSHRLSAPIKKLMGLVEKIQNNEDISKVSTDGHFGKDEISSLTETLIQLSKDALVANKSLQEQNLALDNSAIVAETDPNGIITYVNNKFVSISKFSKKELIGKDHRILNSGEHDKEFFKEMWLKIKNGQVWHNEIKNKAKDGSFYWVDTTIYPVKDINGKIEKFIAIRFDITEKKMTQEKYKVASSQAQKALDSKSMFLANMSHEIRTPLNGIIGFVSLLKDEKLSDEAQSQISYIENCSESLLMIINDILDLSKIEAGKLELNPTRFHLEEEVIKTLSVFQAKVKEKDINLDYKISKNVHLNIFTDGLRLRQILLNLIGNAVKFTPNGGQILVEVFQEKISNKIQQLKISVKDSGIGISPDKQKSLFSAFEQADASTTRDYGGTGLGLTISSRLIEMMGGEIWVESELGKGAKFCISFSCKFNSEERKKEAKLDTSLDLQHNTALKILIVEDNIINQKVITSLLKKLGYKNLDIAENGKIATEMVPAKKYDIIFMDIQMPIMDGHEATRRIRKSINTDVLIYGLSANAFEDDILKGKNSGMDGYLAKPISVKALEEVLLTVSESEAKKAS